LIGLVKTLDLSMLVAVSQRAALSPRLAGAIVARGQDSVTLRLLRRHDVALDAALLLELAAERGGNAEMRGALLGRPDLPAPARLSLVQKASEALRGARIVKGAVAADRLDRMLRDSCDTALSAI